MLYNPAFESFAVFSFHCEHLRGTKLHLENFPENLSQDPLSSSQSAFCTPDPSKVYTTQPSSLLLCDQAALSLALRTVFLPTFCPGCGSLLTCLSAVTLTPAPSQKCKLSRACPWRPLETVCAVHSHNFIHFAGVDSSSSPASYHRFLSPSVWDALTNTRY